MSSSELIGIILAVGGPGGIIAGYVTWRKLRPDTNTAMITQAQGAVGIQDTLMQEQNRHLQGVERERDYWKAEALSERKDNERLREELARVEQVVAELTTQLESVKSDLSALRKTLPDHGGTQPGPT